jgi:hypothetical protein
MEGIKPIIIIAFPTIHVGEMWANEFCATAERRPIIYTIDREETALRGLRGHTIVYVNCGPSSEARLNAGNRNHFIKVTY